MEYEGRKGQVLRVTIDRLYDMLMQARSLPVKGESSLRKDDDFCRFYETMRYNIEGYEEFH